MFSYIVHVAKFVCSGMLLEQTHADINLVFLVGVHLDMIVCSWVSTEYVCPACQLRVCFGGPWLVKTQSVVQVV